MLASTLRAHGGLKLKLKLAFGLVTTSFASAAPIFFHCFHWNAILHLLPQACLVDFITKLLAHLLLELSAQLGFLADSYESGGCVPIRDPRDNVAVQYCVLQLLLGKFCCTTGGVLKKRAPADLEI